MATEIEGKHTMQQIETWTSGQEPSVLIQQLQEDIEPIEEFRLISKLSGAGIVVRTLETPETNKGWMGFQKKGVWQIAQCLEAVNISPYQPIIRLSITPTQVGSTITAEYAPHEDVHLLSVLEWVGGALCVIAGLIGSTANPLAFTAVFLGIGIVVLPRFRARWNFERECERARESLQSLPLDWVLQEGE